jgi:hypothetical protein
MLSEMFYYAARAAEERRIAMASSSLTVRAIHLELASRYEALVNANDDRLFLTRADNPQLKTG